MKTLISIVIVLLFIQEVKAQESPSKKYFLFENPVTKEQIKIEEGNMVTIQFKTTNRTGTGSILSFTDSTLILGVRHERQIVPFENIATMTVIVEAKKRYVVRVTLMNGKMLKGQLVRTTKDSVSILNTRNSQPIRIVGSEIRSIRIRAVSVGQGIAIGACTGVILGVIIGLAATSQQDGWGPGQPAAILALATIGGAVGTAAGAAIGSASKEFKIEGNQAKFDLLANEFMNK